MNIHFGGGRSASETGRHSSAHPSSLFTTRSRNLWLFKGLLLFPREGSPALFYGGSHFSTFDFWSLGCVSVLQTHIRAGVWIESAFLIQAEWKQRYGQMELIKFEKLHIAVIQTLMKDLYFFSPVELFLCKVNPQWYLRSDVYIH